MSRPVITRGPACPADAPIPATRRVGSIRFRSGLFNLGIAIARLAATRAAAKIAYPEQRSLMTAAPRPDQFVLTLSCPSAAGQVAAVVGFLDRHRCYVDALNVFDDDLSNRFFVRCVFHPADETSLRIDALRNEFAPIATGFDMQWAIHDVNARPKVLIMVSKL